MNFENQILDALMIVLARDLPEEEELADAIIDQARLMSGACPEDNLETSLN